MLAGRRDKERGRHPYGKAVLAAIVTRLGKKAESLEIVAVILLQRTDGEGQHRVMRGLAGRDHAQAVVIGGGAEILVEVAAIVDFLEMFETLYRRRSGRIL